MLRGLSLRAVDVKNLGLGLGFAYPLQRLQVMVGLKQVWSQQAPLHTSSANAGRSLTSLHHNFWG